MVGGVLAGCHPERGVDRCHRAPISSFTDDTSATPSLERLRIVFRYALTLLFRYLQFGVQFLRPFASQYGFARVL